MSKFIFLFLVFPVLFLPKTSPNEQQEDYTYLLTVKSLSEQEIPFDLTIKSAAKLGEEPEIQEWKQLKTPYTKELPTGVHTVVVTSSKMGTVMSKLNGVVEGKEKGSVSSSKQKAILNAGPGGQYHTGFPNW